MDTGKTAFKFLTRRAVSSGETKPTLAGAPPEALSEALPRRDTPDEGRGWLTTSSNSLSRRSNESKSISPPDVSEGAWDEAKASSTTGAGSTPTLKTDWEACDTGTSPSSSGKTVVFSPTGFETSPEGGATEEAEEGLSSLPGTYQTGFGHSRTKWPAWWQRRHLPRNGQSAALWLLEQMSQTKG